MFLVCNLQEKEEKEQEEREQEYVRKKEAEKLANLEGGDQNDIQHDVLPNSQMNQIQKEYFQLKLL